MNSADRWTHEPNHIQVGWSEAEFGRRQVEKGWSGVHENLEPFKIIYFTSLTQIHFKLILEEGQLGICEGEGEFVNSADKFVLPGEGLLISGGDSLRIQESAILFPARSFSECTFGSETSSELKTSKCSIVQFNL